MRIYSAYITNPARLETTFAAIIAALHVSPVGFAQNARAPCLQLYFCLSCFVEIDFAPPHACVRTACVPAVKSCRVALCAHLNVD